MTHLEMRYQPLFIVGCPRSGTTWVQLLLNTSPHVATAPETHIFSFYLDQFRRQWIHEHTGPAAVHQGGAGLSRLLSDDEFRELCRLTAVHVLDRIAAGRPEADIVAEKSPQHALMAPWIAEVIPEARFIHVIRDPRDTVASIVRAAGSWGRGWAPRNPIDAAFMWRGHVQGARALQGSPDRYMEVRYESLRADPERGFRDILAWLGIPEGPAFLKNAVAACDLDLVKQGGAAGLPTPGRLSPAGFFGRGSVGGYSSGLSPRAVRTVEVICATLMDMYGYERVTHGASSNRLRIHLLLRRFRQAVDWQLQRLLNWL